MAEYYFPFDSGKGTTVTSREWSWLTSTYLGDGVRMVYAGDDPHPLMAYTSGQDMTVRISPGHAAIQGFHYYSDTDQHVTIAANTGSQPRIDRITLRLDIPGQKIGLAYLIGTPAATPQAPAMSFGTDGIWDTPLARIRVEPQAGAITSDKVTDDRIYVMRPPIHARSCAEPVGYTGELYYENDTKRLKINQTWDDSHGPTGTWRALSDTGASMTPYHPTCRIREFFLQGSYRIAGVNLVYFELYLRAEKTMKVAGDGGQVRPLLPFKADGTARQFIDGIRWNANQKVTPNIVGCKLMITSGATAGTYMEPSRTAHADWNILGPRFSAGDKIHLSGVYSIADGQL